MKLYIHAGTQKTGTTTIQRALHKNRRQLARHGLIYPRPEPDDDNRLSHYNAVRGFFSRGRQDLDGTARFVQRVKAAGSDVLISAENLSSFPPRLAEESLPDYWARKREALLAMKSAFGAADHRVIFCLRKPQAYLKSLFNQYLKVIDIPTRSLDAALERFLSTELHTADYKRQVRIWREVFGDVRVINFDALGDRSLLDSFLDHLDRPLTMTEPRRQNESVGWAALEARRVSLTLGGRAIRPDAEKAEKFDLWADRFITNHIVTALRKADLV